MTSSFEHNIPINRRIGFVGFDSITFSNLINQTSPFQTPIFKTIPGNLKTQNTINSNCTISLSIQKCRIYGSDYIFSYGNQGDRPFSKLKIHASKEGQDNLQNKTLDEMKSRLKEILEEIFQNFCIRIDYDEKRIRIYQAELNITFPTEYPFESYKRILNLMAYVSGQNVKKGTVTNHEHLETFYLLNGKTKKYIVYSKSTDLSEKMNISSNNHLLRYEIFGTEQTLSIISTDEDDRKNHHLHLINLTNENIEKYFYASTNSIFNRIHEYITEKNKKDTSFENPSLLQKIYPFALQRILRTDAASFLETVLHRFHDEENQTGAPELFDIKDLEKHIEESKLPEPDKIQILDTLTQIENRPDHFDPVCRSFIGQNEMLMELQRNLTHKNCYDMTLLQTRTGNKLIYWNASHSQHTIANPLITDPDYDPDPFNPDYFNFLLYKKTKKEFIRKTKCQDNTEIYYTVEHIYKSPNETKTTIITINQDTIEQIKKEIEEQQENILKNYGIKHPRKAEDIDKH